MLSGLQEGEEGGNRGREEEGEKGKEMDKLIGIRLGQEERGDCTGAETRALSGEWKVGRKNLRDLQRTRGKWKGLGSRTRLREA